MTRSEATDLLRRLSAYYPAQRLEPETITVYADDIAPDYDVDDLSSALRAIVRTSRWIPTLAEIRAACAEARVRRVDAQARLSRLESEAVALRARLAAGCPRRGVRVLSRSGAQMLAAGGGARVGLAPLHVLLVAAETAFVPAEEIGEEIVPREMVGAEREEWIRAAEARWRDRVEARLREVERELDEERSTIATPSRLMLEKSNAGRS